jgi:anthraniloyl-CoA monooxygenase
MLILLQERARELGVDCASRPSSKRRVLSKDYDLVVASDGINSHRGRFADVFKPDIDVRKCKFVWLGTHQKFDDAFTFIFEKTEQGWVWAHAYQFDDDTATFIVECTRRPSRLTASAR